MVRAVIEEAAREDMSEGEAERYGARRSMQSFRVGENGFMRLRRPSVENEVGVRQP
jgi:hypothetical protein